jgi:hypothetical protein
MRKLALLVSAATLANVLAVLFLLATLSAGKGTAHLPSDAHVLSALDQRAF